MRYQLQLRLKFIAHAEREIALAKSNKGGFEFENTLLAPIIQPRPSSVSGTPAQTGFDELRKDRVPSIPVQNSNSVLNPLVSDGPIPAQEIETNAAYLKELELPTKYLEELDDTLPLKPLTRIRRIKRFFLILCYKLHFLEIVRKPEELIYR